MTKQKSGLEIWSYEDIKNTCATDLLDEYITQLEEFQEFLNNCEYSKSEPIKQLWHQIEKNRKYAKYINEYWKE